MANKTIGGLPNAGPITGAELLELEQSGQSVQESINSILSQLTIATAYTTSLGSDIGGGTSTGLRYHRLGKYMRIFGAITLGTTASGVDNWFSMPSGLTIDTTDIVSRVTKLGEATRLTSGSNDVDGGIVHHLCYDSGLGAGKIRLTVGVASGVYRQSGGNNFSSSEVVNIVSEFIPVEEW